MKRMEDEDIFEGGTVMYTSTPRETKEAKHKHSSKKLKSMRFDNKIVPLIDFSHQSEPFPASLNESNVFLDNAYCSTASKPNKKFYTSMGFNETIDSVVDIVQRSELFPPFSNATNADSNNASSSTANQPQTHKKKKYNLSMGFNDTNAHLGDVAQYSKPFRITSNVILNNPSAGSNNATNTAANQAHQYKHKKYNSSVGFDDTNSHLADEVQHSEPFPSTANVIFDKSSIPVNSKIHTPKNKEDKLAMGKANAHLVDVVPSTSITTNTPVVSQHSQSFVTTSMPMNETNDHLANATPSTPNAPNTVLVDAIQHTSTSTATNDLLNDATTATNVNIMAMLQKILQKQIDLESTITEIEKKIPELEEAEAHHKVMRDSKILIKKTHKIVCRISGETENDIHTEISTLMPLASLDAIYDIEQKLNSDDYQESMKSYIFMLKGTSSDLNAVIRKLFSDNALYYFNYDGKRGGKRSLSKLKLVNDVLFDVFKLQGRIDFDDAIRKCLILSHNRHKQQRYLKNKLSSEKI